MILFERLVPYYGIFVFFAVLVRWCRLSPDRFSGKSFAPYFRAQTLIPDLGVFLRRFAIWRI